MKTFRPGLAVCCIGLAAVFLCGSLAVGEEIVGSNPGVRKYVALYFAQHTVNGDFTDNRILSSPNGTFGVPSVNRGDGYGLAVGGWTRWVGIEGSYWRASPSVRFDDQDGDGTYQLFSVEGRFFPHRFGIFHPYLATGVFMEWLTVENGYCSDMSGGVCRERFNGFGVSIGGGANAYVTDRVFISGQVRYRNSEYNSVRSVDISDGTLSYDLDGAGWTWGTGLGLEF